MVLPASAADPGAAEAAWLGKIVRLLERARRGIIILLQDATPNQLGPVVRSLSPSPPWTSDAGVAPLRVCLKAPELADVPPGSRVLLRVQPEDATWLNLRRPLIIDNDLRLLLWADDGATRALASAGIDFFDWISRVIAVPEAPLPEFALDGLRAALELDAPIAWSGPGLDACLAALGAGEDRVQLRRDTPYHEMLTSLARPGRVIVDGLERERDAWRVRAALAHAGRERGWIARDPAGAVAGSWPLGAELADWEGASANLAEAGWKHAALAAAWFDLEPGRIESACARGPIDPRAAHVPAVNVACAIAPTWVLRTRARDEDVRAALEQLREGPVPDEDAARVRWSERSRSPIEDDALSLPPVVAGLRALTERGGEAVPDVRLVDMAAGAQLVDVATELGLRRWKLGAKVEPERLIQWLLDRGQARVGLDVARAWAEATARRSVSGRARAQTIERARARVSLVKVARLLAEPDGGRDLLEQSIAELERLLERRPKDRRASEVLLSLLQCSRIYGDSTREIAVMNSLAASEPAEFEARVFHVRVQLGVGNLIRDFGMVGDFAVWYRRAESTLDALISDAPQRIDLALLRANIDVNWACWHMPRGALDAAVRHFNAGLDRFRQLLIKEPALFCARLSVAHCQVNLGEIARARGQLEFAQLELERARAELDDLARLDPHRFDVEDVRQHGLVSLARLLFHGMSEAEASRATMMTAITHARAWRERDRYHTPTIISYLANGYLHLGSLARARGNTIEARRQFMDALALHEEIEARGLTLRDPLLRQFAQLYEQMSDVEPTRAIYWLDRAMKVWRQLLERDRSSAIVRRSLAKVLCLVGGELERRKLPEQAQEHLVEGHELFEALRSEAKLPDAYLPLADEVAGRFVDQEV